MQITNIFTILAVAMTAAAAPAEMVARTGGGGSTTPGTCSTNEQPVCCNSIGLDLLLCAVNVLGGSCSGTTFCCSTNAAPGTVVNVQLLNCVSL
ncbi:hypothetical protein B0T17DRAFT_513601 [Bombardia bombarda]|uniref:Hydrophobin n=1 Tax=Bombardia bombarda TaxID=252184 RepID=A0AA39XIB8_9PEZI|nr:hypothetical protein B0T17DRAFT_513601 [Bombardia bombarda]